MKLNEVIKVLEDNQISDKIEYLAKKINVSNATIRRMLSTRGIKYNSKKALWTYDIELIDKNDNILLSRWMSENPLKPNNSIKWDCDQQLITKDEVIQILKTIDIFNNSSWNKLSEDQQYRIAVYVTEYLDHPLDALFVTKEMAKTIRIRKPPLPIASCINTIGFCIAFKREIKIPIEISASSFKRFEIKSIQSIQSSKANRDGIDINCYVRAIIPFIKNLNIVESELYQLNKTQRKFISVSKGSNLYYIIFTLLLNAKSLKQKCKVDWLSLNFLDLDVKSISEINRFLPYCQKDVIALNFIYFLKLSTKRFFPCNNFEQFAQSLLEDEISYHFILYKHYMLFNSRSIEAFQKANQVLSYKPKELTKVNQLSVDNIKKWFDCYINNAKKSGLQQETAWRRLNYFCTVLYEMKEIFEENNLYDLKIKFPYSKHEIRGGNRKIYRWKSANSAEIQSSVVEGESNIKTVMEYGIEKVKILDTPLREGTFKEDIDIVDKFVRAIYNYEFKSEEGTIDYFNELQLITMLRIIADAGVRVSEVINMMFGTLSYIEEEETYICVLGWSKIFERFGVVPISSDTALLIERCMEIRRTHYSETLTVEHDILDGTKSKLKSETKYVLQFVFIDPKRKDKISCRRISRYRLTEFFNELCSRAEVEITEGKLFHALRHRAAEYFFFCLSYYDFEYKNDYEYKELVVKRLLRHRSKEMTKKYNWSRLLDILTSGRLVFMKSLPDLANYSNVDSKIHENSIKSRIKNELTDVLTSTSIEKIIKLLTLPFGLINEELLETISKEKSFKIVLDNLSKVDGNKGFVPEGAAYFGLCTNFSCPKLFNKISCISCNDHILQASDISMAIGEIIRCHKAINDIYCYHYDEVSSIDHIKSLRSRVTSLLERLHKELEIAPFEIIEMISKGLESTS
ncbi:hypothetical protein [Peribacillus sp. Hz7]|uniref:hypothetical protein n=1 Tax=Peribacillus sp. Hz7 TaxID=3344873 RepID=UPI0035C9F1F2